MKRMKVLHLSLWKFVKISQNFENFSRPSRVWIIMSVKTCVPENKVRDYHVRQCIDTNAHSTIKSNLSMSFFKILILIKRLNFYFQSNSITSYWGTKVTQFPPPVLLISSFAAMSQIFYAIYPSWLCLANKYRLEILGMRQLTKLSRYF